MDWDQIESKWAAMTRRVRSDLPFAQGGKKITVPASRAEDDITRLITDTLPDVSLKGNGPMISQ